MNHFWLTVLIVCLSLPFLGVGVLWFVFAYHQYRVHREFEARHKKRQEAFRK